MERTTRKRLEFLLSRVASLQNRPTETWRNIGEKTQASNNGALLLDHNPTYGGYKVAEICGEHGGENDLCDYRMTPKETEFFLLGMLCALEGSGYWPSSNYMTRVIPAQPPADSTDPDDIGEHDSNRNA